MAPWPRALRLGVLLLSGTSLQRVFFDAGAWRGALPEEGRSATEVVRLQLTALQENNPENDDGIAKTFDFASTRNKAVTGPLPRFAHMIHAGYPLLLNSQNFTLLSALQLGPTEYAVRVEILGNLQMGNQKGIFVWQLSDSGDGTGWRTDAVMPDEQTFYGFQVQVTNAATYLRTQLNAWRLWTYVKATGNGVDGSYETARVNERVRAPGVGMFFLKTDLAIGKSSN
eukprot:s4255_g1.t2